MDMILTIIASTFMLVGFFVICRSSDEEEEEESVSDMVEGVAVLRGGSCYLD